MVGEPWTVVRGEGPMVAVAIHHGHDLRDEVAAAIVLGDAARLREEDPFTGVLAEVVPTRVVVQRSRFEVDLNRPRDTCVYRRPEQAWGLRVWADPPPDDLVARSLELHDRFYAELEALLDDVINREGRCCVLDVHSYNHRRAGPAAPPEDPAANPQLNIGTRSLDHERWGALVDAFTAAAVERSAGLGHDLDVRQNVRFGGGHLARHVHGTRGGRACVLALEFVKTFMDEWTGELIEGELERLRSTLAAGAAGAERWLRR